MHLRDQQLKYEEDTDNAAAAERLEQLRLSATEGDVNLPRAQRYIARAYTDVKKSLDDAIAVKTRGVGGKFKGWLRKVPTDVAAVLALKECISCIVTGSRNNSAVTIQILGLAIGKLFELEIRIRDAEAVNPLYMKRIHDQVQDNATTSQSHLRKLYNTAYAAVMKDEGDDVLSQVEMLQLGKFGVQACLDAGVIVSSRSRSKAGIMVAYELAPEVSEFLTDYTDSDVQMVMNKASGAMMCEPDPWTGLRDGGYLSPRRKLSQPLLSMSGIRKSERARLRGMFTAEKMPMIFECANYFQSRKFALHEPTMQAILRVWQSGGGTMGVPLKAGPQKPEFPFAEDWDRDGAPEAEQQQFTDWKRSMAAYYTEIRLWRAKVREVSGFLRTAGLAAKDGMWFPVFLDKRGRWYYRGTPNPQGSDLSKAALHYGNKKPLGDRGLHWLKVHVANCFGFDKPRFGPRSEWTDAHWDTISAALDDPENHPDVWGTDAPWCMYSAAWELREALRSGHPASYETGLIVHMDATCSGLQHFSAILRDPVGGSFVNLTDAGGEFKQDIYARVALNALRVIEQDSTDSDQALAAVAQWWLTTGIPRSMAKKPVMTYVYGATLRGTVDFVEQYVYDELGLKFPEGVRPYDYAAYAAKKLFQGIAATVPAAEAAMNWLKAVAKQQPKGQRMEWTSPTGFPVQHDYQDYDEVRVKLRSCGVTDVLIREYNEDTKPLPMQNAIAPNFVHALDAAHITKCALLMKRLGLDMVGIHDSYGTHPGDVDALHECIRESFVDLYQSRNVLSEFLWEVNGVGEVPMRGTLDLAEVRESEFFFC